MPFQSKPKPANRASWRKVPITFEDSKAIRIPVSNGRTKQTYNARELRPHLGQWVNFNTRWGDFRGVIEDVSNSAVLVKMPKEHNWNNILATYSKDIHGDVHTVGHPGPRPYWAWGPWCWCWFPIVVVIFIFPWFCW